jgi:hypothetical protein
VAIALHLLSLAFLKGPLGFYPGFALQPANNTIQFIHQRWVLSRGASITSWAAGRTSSSWLERDIEGIVGKWRFATYRTDGAQTSWIKVKNPTYSQAEGRHALFEKRRPKWDRSKRVRSELRLM